MLDHEGHPCHTETPRRTHEAPRKDRMRSHNPRLSALLLVDPKEAERLIVGAVRKAGGDMKKASAELGIDRRTLYRWFAQYPKLEKKCKAVREDASP